jgi:pimeloyl-ACP methyl ester carboxylesterase
MILDVDEISAFSVGGGYVYVTRPLLDALLSGKERGRNALAFVLAQELGHIAEQHCRRGYQLQLIQEEIKNGVGIQVKEELLKSVLKTSAAPPGSLAKFAYASFQEDEADLFAAHLCRNAGFDLEQAEDALRWMVAVEQPRVLTDPQFRPEPTADRSTAPFYLSSHPPALRRLKHLEMERTGGVDDEARFGMFSYDRATGKLTKAGDGAVGQDEKAVVFLHGLHGDESSFSAMMAAAAKSDDLKQAKLLFFRYPNDMSLSRSGELLAREMARVVKTPAKASFVGHSAGGLVTRYYIERKRGAFDKAVFIATPHHGSSLTRLKYLLDAGVFLDRVFKLDLLSATAQAIAEGCGEMGPDLEPDSLFLRYLDAEPKMADRYYVVYGRVQKRLPGAPIDTLAAFGTSLAISRPLLKRQFTMSVKSEILKAVIREGVDQLVVPTELINGDLVVSVYSARLKGAKDTIETDLDHIGIVRDAGVIEKVVPIVAGR